MCWRPAACAATKRRSRSLAKNKTVTGRLWTYLRDDQPFGCPAPPTAVFFYSYSRHRAGEHPNRHLAGYAGILQADA
jgi:transposase